MTEQQVDTENYWQNELRSLGVESKRRNKLNDKKELQALADTIKQVYYQDYKTAYSEEDENKVKASDFGYII
jgi:glucan phosphorylase